MINDELKKELGEMKAKGLYKATKTITSKQGPEIEIEGKKILNFCANNYLGLAGSDVMIQVAKEGLEKYGFGMSSVRFICGTATVHDELEQEIAKFFGFESAILYGSCFDANTGLFETLLSGGDPSTGSGQDAVFSDELNHASIIDGIRLCKAERFRYKHSDMGDLEAQLIAAGDRPRKLIVTDGIFSMDGETAKLAEISALAKKYNALLMVDDSHGSGAMGKTGRGSIEGIQGIDILTSTFGKALGGASGGFTAASKEIVEYLKQRSRPYLFSNTLVPAVAHAALYVLKNYEKEFSPLLTQLSKNTEYFRNKMLGMGYTLGGDGTHPITPVMFPDELSTMKAADALFEQGIYVRGFVYPVVPQGKPRIRVQISAAHTRDHLDTALRAFGSLSPSQ